jgi:hypothetical protein
MLLTALPATPNANARPYAAGGGGDGEVSEVQLDEIALGAMLGQGAYGTVHYGEWRSRWGPRDPHARFARPKLLPTTPGFVQPNAPDEKPGAWSQI